MNRRFCTECGRPLQEGDVFCRRCGASVGTKPAAEGDGVAHSSAGARDEQTGAAAAAGADREPSRAVPPESALEPPARLSAAAPADVAEHAATEKAGSPPAERRRGRPAALWVGAAAAAALVVAAIIVLATGVLSDGSRHPGGRARATGANAATAGTPGSSSSAAQASTSSPGASTGVATASTADLTSPSASVTTAATPISTPLAKQQVIGVLSAYAQDFSRRSILGLSQIFSPSVSRRGLAAGGCTISRGRSAVLAAYASQFREGTGAYRLVGLSPASVVLTGTTQASVAVRFAITDGNSGNVAFELSRSTGGWVIVNISAKC